MAQAIEAARAAQAAQATDQADLPWRVISLLNVFRLLVPMVLLLVFFFDAAQHSVGGRLPGAFIGTCVAWFAFGIVSISTIQRRWPDAQWQALIQLAADTIAVTFLIHASGGMSSGLATLLVLPSGATAAIVKPRLALGATASIVIILLFQTFVSALSAYSSSADFFVAGLTGVSLFAITLLALPMANRLRESEARVQQRDFDLANLSELNEFIVQHLRESILVVDAEDRIRLINETASRLLKGETVLSGELLGEVSPRLLYLLETWRTTGVRPAGHDHRSRLRGRRHGGPATVHTAVPARTRAGAGFPGRHEPDGRARAAVEARGARAAERQHRSRDPQSRRCDESREPAPA